MSRLHVEDMVVSLGTTERCYGSGFTCLPRLYFEGIVVSLGTTERYCNLEEVRPRGRKLVLTSGHILEGNSESQPCSLSLSAS